MRSRNAAADRRAREMTRTTRRTFIRAAGAGLAAGMVGRMSAADAQAEGEEAAVDDMILVPAGRPTK